MPVSYISKQELNAEDAVQAKEVRDYILKFIRIKFPSIGPTDYLSKHELNLYRRNYLDDLIKQEKIQLNIIKKDVSKTIAKNAVLSNPLKSEDDQDEPMTVGEAWSDRIATFGGSWTFIFIFFLAILSWIVFNITTLVNPQFDPYPFILLNLILSCLASIQAPIIMMSQNRKEKKDRIRAEHDYIINQRAELEIKLLGSKLDHILIQQNRNIIEIQQIQIDYLEDLILQNQVKNRE